MPVPLVVVDPKPYPNPSNGSPVNFDVSGGPYDKVRITIFSLSMRKIYDQTYPGNGLTSMTLVWDLKDASSKVAANGIYFVSIETFSKGATHRYLKKVLILR